MRLSAVLSQMVGFLHVIQLYTDQIGMLKGFQQFASFDPTFSMKLESRGRNHFSVSFYLNLNFLWLGDFGFTLFHC